MKKYEWPKHPTGRPLKMREMTHEQRRAAWRASVATVRNEFAAKCLSAPPTKQ